MDPRWTIALLAAGGVLGIGAVVLVVFAP